MGVTMKKVSAPKPTKNPISKAELKGAGDQPELSAKIGGIGNTAKNATKDYTRGK
jgi:hypothetical protein